MIKLSLIAWESESGGGESVLARPNPTKSDQTLSLSLSPCSVTSVLLSVLYFQLELDLSGIMI